MADIDKAKKKSVMYSLFALFFAVVLFYTANGSYIRNPIIHQGSQFKETVDDVPVELIYDQKKFFVQGFDPYVSVKLTSDNRIQLSAEKNKETRRFRIVADLSKLSVGTHEVPLKVKDAKSGVTVTLFSKSIVATIENKISKKMPVSVLESELNLQEGIKLSKIQVDPEEIEVTTGDETMKEIVSVKADVSKVKSINKDTAVTVPLKVVNHKGEELPAILNPSRVMLHLTVKKESRTVALAVVPVGRMSSKVESMTYAVSPKTIEVEGEKIFLDKLDHLSVPVDISGIVTNQTVEVPISFENDIQSNMKMVKVTISPKLIDQTNESTSTTNQTKPSTADSSTKSTSKSTSKETETSKSSDSSESDSKTDSVTKSSEAH